jgi:opacity protein-like surface antigen
MTKRRILARTLSLFLFIPACSLLHAQDAPSATRSGQLQAGLAVSEANTDYQPKDIVGATLYVDFDFAPHLGVEGDYHYLNGITPNDFAENSYLIGLRYNYRLHERYVPYAKVLYGIGSFDADEPYVKLDPGYGQNYGILAFAGGLDVDVSHNFTVRVDYERQDWYSFKPNGLSPTIASFGIAYRIR